MTLTEGDLQFDFSAATSAKRFDDASHGLSHCMKAVDFVVELHDRILFVEVKDPQNPNAKPAQVQEFVKELQSGELVRGHLTPKYRDSYLYEHAMGHLSKPVHFVVLVALDTLSAPELSTQTDLLTAFLPVDGPPDRPWTTRFAESCSVVNIEAWNAALAQLPVSRLSAL